MVAHAASKGHVTDGEQWMQRFARGALVLLLLVAGMIFTTGTAQACSCALGSPVDQMERADAVFTGEIVERSGKRVDKVGKNAYTAGQFTYTIEVDRVFKGEVNKVQEIVAGTGESSCGVVFPEDGPILVFGTSTGGVGSGKVAPDQYGTNLCSGSQTTSSAPASFGEGEPPIGAVPAAAPQSEESEYVDSTLQGWAVLAGIGGLTIGLIGLTAWLLMMKRRRDVSSS